MSEKRRPKSLDDFKRKSARATKTTGEKVREVSFREHHIQAAIIAQAQVMQRDYPELDMLFSIPNEHENVWERRACIKRGLKKGVPDLTLQVARRGFHGLWMEVKRKTGRVIPEQKVFGEKLIAEGYLFKVVRSVDEAINIFKWYLDEEI